MNSIKLTKKIFIGLSVVMMAASVACNPVGETALADPSVNTTAAQESAPAVENAQAVEPAVSIDGLTDIEVEGLLFMREEEKLAGDVYRYFYDLWGNAVFQNIADSEDAHTESVLSLLNQYGVADPASMEAGVFSNADLQALYDQLTAQGSQSLADALLVGAAIEEIDILDLENNIAQTENANIRLVYENLSMGSENHLRAFVRVLSNQTGMDYKPSYLTQERYEAIMQDVNGAGQNPGGQGNVQGSGYGKNS